MKLPSISFTRGVLAAFAVASTTTQVWSGDIVGRVDNADAGAHAAVSIAIALGGDIAALDELAVKRYRRGAHARCGKSAMPLAQLCFVKIEP